MSSQSKSETTGIEDTLALGPKATSAVLPESETGGRIGPYRLLQLIGEGGMGEVWLAEQLEPRRKVAIKVIKAGMDTKQVVARFESERQALALMDHPAIAKVFDGGSTPEGRPYFVMEYVAGVPITEHCDTHRLSTLARLELFNEVCEGVQHAHQKAIIHRDLKPSNILVSLADGRAQPKIIDFGIAKATAQRLTEKTLFTEVGAVIGTPEYMSPEQADLTGQDVDTRTDVYSLGVILYQLLAGELPFGSKELRSSSYEELKRKLKEDEPPKPSTKLSTLGDEAADVAKKRDTDPGALRRQLEGDLDAITMKALEKERARRYGTPSELATDIERHLRNEPVLARPPSRAYRLQKYVRRHRVGVAIGSGLVLLLLSFAAAMAVQVKRIAEERDRADAWLRYSSEETGKAHREAAVAQRTADSLTRIVASVLEVAAPVASKNTAESASSILNTVAGNLDEGISANADLEAALLVMVARGYDRMQANEKAKELFNRAVEVKWQVLPSDKRTDDARKEIQAGLAFRFLIGYPQRARWSWTSIGDQSQLLEVERRLLGSDNMNTLETQLSFSKALYEDGHLGEAQKLLRDALNVELLSQRSQVRVTVNYRNELGRALRDEQLLDEADGLLRETLKLAQHQLGPTDFLTGFTRVQLAAIALHRGRQEESLDILREVLADDSLHFNGAWFESHPDFQPLRGDPRFDAMMVEARRRSEAAH
jgi:eukaryotic-like serine/threonine-protein kinase